MAKLLIYESRRLVLPLETAVDAVLELDRERGGRLTLASLRRHGGFSTRAPADATVSAEEAAAAAS